jgi:hypothetical protein
MRLAARDGFYSGFKLKEHRHGEGLRDVAIHADLDCRASLSMNSPVIANVVKQSMHSEVMDRHALLAMTVQGPCGVSGRVRRARNDETGRTVLEMTLKTTLNTSKPYTRPLSPDPECP